MSSTFALCSILFAHSVHANSFSSKVVGYEGDMDDVTVILENPSELRSTSPNNLGEFTFSDLEPGEYFVKVQTPGYSTSSARLIKVPSAIDPEPFRLVRLNQGADTFRFHWEEDQSTSGLEYSSNVIEPVTIKFLDEPVEVVDSAQAGSLLSEFNVVLADDGEKWTSEHTHRLHEMLSITASSEIYYLKSGNEVRSRWILTADEVASDIAVVKNEDGSRDVKIAASAFTNASPKMVEIEGRRGIWYSQRLHHAVVRYVTDFGQDRREVARILNDRYGVKLDADIRTLTRNTTSESAASFENFKAREYVDLINMLEEMPRGFHRIPQLKYIVRRADGMPHPRYPQAPAVAWPDSGYIEFMESAFQQTKDDWIAVGEWYKDPNAKSGWSTHQTTQFVSAYAHLKNPDEDLAESIADFVVNPDVLRSRAPHKYEFIRDRLMAGSFYVSTIREDLTFEVYNLFPDYIFPGKIKSVDIRVEGDAAEDKILLVTVELHALDTKNEAARHAYVRISSDVGTFFDMFLYPIDDNGNRISSGTRLHGTYSLSKFAKAGYWYPVNIVIGDDAGNKRYQRNNTFEMKIHLENPLEDYTKPSYVANTMEMNVREESRKVFGIEREVQVINVTWDVDEDNALRSHQPCLTRMVVNISDTGSYDEYGQMVDDKCSVDFVMPDYMPTGDYSVRYVSMIDLANNWGRHVFLQGSNEEIPTISLSTRNPDSTPPELDVNRIYVVAEPTNPDHPNGETLVEITYFIRDDNSGLFDTGVNLRDPQGGKHFQWHLVPDRDALFSRAAPNEWQRLVMHWTLPKGSPPGTWGISSMMVQDKASNEKRHNFTEVIHVDVQNSNPVMHLTRGFNPQAHPSAEFCTTPIAPLSDMNRVGLGTMCFNRIRSTPAE